MRSVAWMSLLLLPLFALIGTLLLRGPRPNDPVYRQTLDSLHQIALQQAALDRDVLRAHDGLLQDYDPLVDEIDSLRAAALQLQQQATAYGWNPPAVSELAAQIDAEEAAVEQFKTDNALLQNSLAYVDLASASLGGSSADPEVALMVGRLANDLLHLIRSPTGEIERSVSIRLADMQALLASRDNPAELKAMIERLESHARLLSITIPGVDADLRQIAAESTSASWTRLSQAADSRHAMEERRATRFQAAILVTTALLLVVLVRLALLLRSALRKQRQRTSLERAITKVSMDLVGRYAPDTEGGMHEAVEALGKAFDADRAFLALKDNPLTNWAWSADGAVADEGRLQKAFELVAASSAPETDLIRVPATARLQPGLLRDLLTASGLVACCGAVLRHQGHPFGLFLLGRTRPHPDWPAEDGPLRMAAEVVGNAARRRIEQCERADLEARQMRASRLEALGTFASGIAHNFNNVIGAVLGYAEMAAEGLPAEATAARYVHEIHQAGERAQDLVARILEFGTRGRSNREILRLDELLAETASMLRVSLPQAADLVVGPGGADGYVVAEPAQLQQAIVNLVRNAVEASGPGKRVTVRTSCERVTIPRRLSHGTAAPGRYVRIAVVDTGIGMDTATLEQIFRPFFTTRPAGTGLGLATVREIVQDQGGVLDVRSRPGHGSAFEVWLSAADPSGEAGLIPAPGDGQSILVLAATAEEVLRDEEMLAALSYEPIGFTSTDAALAAVAGGPGRFDAFLLGAGPARQSGGALLAAVARLAPSSPILLTASAPSELEAVQRDRDYAMLPPDAIAAILLRPLRSPSLAAALARGLQRRGASGPHNAAAGGRTTRQNTYLGPTSA